MTQKYTFNIYRRSFWLLSFILGALILFLNLNPSKATGLPEVIHPDTELREFINIQNRLNLTLFNRLTNIFSPEEGELSETLEEIIEELIEETVIETAGVGGVIYARDVRTEQQHNLIGGNVQYQLWENAVEKLSILQSHAQFYRTAVADIFIAKDYSLSIGTDTIEFSLTMDNDGGIMARGTFGSGNTLTSTGTGTRFIWYPKKAALRVGYISGSGWDDANIGNYSVALGGGKASGIKSVILGGGSLASGSSSLAAGSDTTASGDNSTAMGNSTVASGNNSISMGLLTLAGGLNSIATGDGTTASGVSSTAMGYDTTASGVSSTAMGYDTTADGDNSTATGNNTTASGIDSTAMGAGSVASGARSTAIGNGTVASGSRSTAMGQGTTASGYISTAMGNETKATAENSTTIGLKLTNNTTNSFMVGFSTYQITTPSFAVFKSSVGIGTATPDERLHIAGNIKIDNDIINIEGALTDSTVVSADIKDGTITSDDIADGTISGSDLTENSIGSFHIINSTIQTVDIGDDQITVDKLAHGINAVSIGFDADKVDGYHFADFFSAIVTFSDPDVIKTGSAPNYWGVVVFEGNVVYFVN